MKRVFSIFVSSVQKELAAERRALKDYITRDPMLGRFFPDVFLFEDLPARDQQPDERYIGEIDRRDIYLGIFGLTYGRKDQDGLSPTAREFHHATHNAPNRPERIILVKGLDDSGREPEMVKLILTAGAQLTRRRFIDSSGLLREVYNSLVDFLEEHHLLRTPPFDSAPCPGATLKNISAEKVREFLRLAGEKGRFQPVGPRTPAHVLRHFHLLADGHPTQAGVFLFGDKPAQFLHQTQLHCLQFEGTEKRKPISDQRAFEGSVFETIDAARQFVLSKLATRVGLAAGSASAPVQPEIPAFVIREAIVNAVAHRDYTSDGFVQVIVFSDRVEVWNPGRLPAGLSEEDLRHPHGPLPRNPLIAEPLFRAGYAEKAGSGTTDMIEACRTAGVPEPDFKQHGPHFVVTLWRDWLTDEVLARLEFNDRQMQAVALVKRQGRISNAEFQKLTGASPRTALRELTAMVEAGTLFPVGSGRSAAYSLARKRAMNTPSTDHPLRGNAP
jgi:predicted HTH transcriptional regulator